MYRWSVGVGALLMALHFSPSLFGDIPITPAREGTLFPVEVRKGELKDRDPNVIAKIVLPRSFARAGAIGDEAPAAGDEMGVGPMGSIIAGLLLTGAAASFLFLMRARQKLATVGASVCTLLLVATAASVLHADLSVGFRRNREPVAKEKMVEIKFSDDESVTIYLKK